MNNQNINHTNIAKLNPFHILQSGTWIMNHQTPIGQIRHGYTEDYELLDANGNCIVAWPDWAGFLRCVFTIANQ